MNKLKVEIHAEARIDLYTQIEYLASKDIPYRKLLDFVLEMEEASNVIARNPLTWPRARPSKLVRKFGPTKHFHYLVYYIVSKEGTPRIIEFSGPGRQPRWAGRL